MKKRFLLWFLFLLVGMKAFSQQEIVIGSGEGESYYLPLCSYNVHSWTEMIYLSSDIPASGNISSIAFYVSSIPVLQPDVSSIRIFLGTTSKTQHDNNADWLGMEDLVEVYNATSMTIPLYPGWQTFDLDTPFPYDGSGNLVVAVGKSMTPYSTSLKYAASTTNRRNLYRGHDSDSSYRHHPGGSSGFTSFKQPDIKLGFGGSPNCPFVTNLVVEDVSSNDAEIRWDRGEEGSQYILQCKKSSQSWDDGEVMTVSLNDTVYAFSGQLLPATTYDVRVARDCGADTSAWRKVAFTTECVLLSTLPLYWDFESRDEATRLPTCWQKNTTGQAEPNVQFNGVYAQSGEGFLSFHGNTGIAVLPPVDTTVLPLNTLQLRFSLYQGLPNTLLSVGVVEDTSDLSTFVQVDSVRNLISPYSSFNHFTVPLDQYSGTGVHIALKLHEMSEGIFLHLDDLYLEEIPECRAPDALQVPGVSSSSVTLAWEGDANLYNVYYRADGETDWEAIYQTSCENGGCVVENLQPSTRYQWKVATVCGDDTEAVSTMSFFSTSCLEITELPYVCGFETVSPTIFPLPECWMRGSLDSENPYVDSNNLLAHDGFRYLRVYGSGATAALPPVDPTGIDLTLCQLSFYARVQYWATDMEVGVMGNPADYTSFVAVDTVHLDGMAYGYYSVSLDRYEGDGKFVAFRGMEGQFVYIDDVALELTPACSKPLHLAAHPSVTSASLSWSSNADIYDLYFKMVTDSVWTVLNGVSLDADSLYYIEGLTPHSAYEWYVQTVCGDIQESVSEVSYFSTFMNSETLPYVFSANDTWLLNNGTNVNGWAKGVLHDSLDVLFVTNNGTDAGYDITAASSVTAEKHFLVGTSNTVVLSFDLKCGGESYYDYLKVFLAPQDKEFLVGGGTAEWATASYSQYAVDFSEYFPLTTTATSFPHKINLTQDSLVHMEFQLDSPVPDADENTVVKLVFGWRNDDDFGTQPGALVANLRVETISCDRPSVPTVSDVQATTAKLDWTAPEGNDLFVVQYSVSGTGWEDPAVVTVSAMDTTVTLTDLLPATTYQVRVASDCGGDTSLWRSVLFTTECAALTTLPYYCGFETVPSGLYQLPSCWVRGSNSTVYPYSNASISAYEGGRVLYFNMPNSVALPAVDTQLIDLNNTQISFYAKGADAKLMVGVMSSPDDINTFVAVDTLTLTASYEYYEVLFTQYQGTGCFVAFQNMNDQSIYLDKVVLENIPTCSRPENLVVSNPTLSSVDLSWSGTADAYCLYYKIIDAPYYTKVQGVALDDNQVYTLSGLISGQIYSWYVAAVCEDSTEAAIQQAGVFAVPCESLTELPVTWGFESYQPFTQLPECWRVLNPTASGPKIMNEYAHGGVKSLRLYDNTPSSTVILPLVDNTLYPVNTLQVRFFAMNSGTYDSWNVCVVGGVITDPYDASTFVATDSVFVVGAAGGSHQEYVLNMSSYQGSDGIVAFRFKTISGAKWLNIDDLTLTVNTDTVPVQLPQVFTAAATNIAQTTATLNGNVTNPDHVTVTAKGFEWKVTADGIFTQVGGVGADSLFTADLTGLTPGTGVTYKAFVMFNGQTVYGDEVTFTTLEDEIAETCDSPTGLLSTDIQNEAVTIAWDANANVSSWNIQFRVVGTTTWSTATSNTNSYTVTGLTGLTNYEFQIQADCGDGNVSDWSQSATAQTTNVGIANCLENSVALFPNPANSMLNVQCAIGNEAAAIELLEVYGKLLQTMTVAGEVTTINVSGLADGMYFVRVTTEQGAVTKSFVKR